MKTAIEPTRFTVMPRTDCPYLLDSKANDDTCPSLVALVEHWPVPRDSGRSDVYLEELLRERGWTNERQPGYLGLVVNTAARTVSRNGLSVRFGVKEFDLFQVIYRAKKSKLDPQEVSRSLGRTHQSCRTMVTTIRGRLVPLGITIEDYEWTLVDIGHLKSKC